MGISFESKECCSGSCPCCDCGSDILAIKPSWLKSAEMIASSSRSSCCAQNSLQNSTKQDTTGPVRVTAPSNQSSQLTLQEGNTATFLSTMINFGCITENGKRKILLTCISKPCSCSGDGRFNVDCHDSGE